MSTTEHEPIPQPPTVPMLGNLPELRRHHGTLGLMELAREHGPIYRLSLPGGRAVVVVSSRELVDELCDESRFGKVVFGGLLGLRDVAGDGLFTAHTTEPNWGKAHHILMSAFGPIALRGMTGDMLDIAEQLLDRWERFGPDQPVDVAGDATRLTLDTIALCAFSHRFNSMYSDSLNPFIGAMVRAMAEAGARAIRSPLQTRLEVHRRHQYDEDVRSLLETADDFVAGRRERPLPAGRTDVLDRLLTAADPQTGERLSAENVRFQLVTFLIAGHETTSGLITFALYELLKNPELLARARAEVDDVLGTRRPRFEDLAALGYLRQVLSEALRLWPPAASFALRPHQDTVLAGRYAATHNDVFLVLSPQLHRDPAVWEDPERFDPGRFGVERAQRLPPNAWKPFGNGSRACIGRGFALQEATLFLAMALQRFDLSLADPDYDLRIRQALTIKPDGFAMTVRRRAVTLTDAPEQARAAVSAAGTPNGIPVTILYGSTAGTSESLARRVADDARRRGYTPSVSTLDSAAGHLPTDGIVVAVTASYEGLPPGNAARFVDWLHGLRPGALDGVRFAVFGCGNRDWARTYQRIPTLVDTDLDRAGARRVVDRGEGDARGDLLGDFDGWYADFWTGVDAEFGQVGHDPARGATLQVRFVDSAREPLLRRNGMQTAVVMVNRSLVAPGAARDKRHIELALPGGMSYRPGDYLAVLPRNSAGIVDRVLTRFGLDHDSTLVLDHPDGSLPVATPVTAEELLSTCVELSRPATRRQIDTLARVTADPGQRATLAALAGPDHAEQVLRRRITVLDLLERHPSCGLSLASFLQMLVPLAARRYSISSSPRHDSTRATVTVSVLRAPALSGSGLYEGVASCHLAGARPGSRVAVAVHPSTAGFHPPATLRTPLVMIGAGSGIAPFRGFLQDRAIRASASGVAPTPALLFFGCDDAEVDYLYRPELEDWAAAGIVELHPAFSHAHDGVPHVQDRLWQDREQVAGLFREGAVVLVCGDGHAMAPAVHDTCARIYREQTGCSTEEADAWLDELARERSRYLTDVFS